MPAGKINRDTLYSVSRSIRIWDVRYLEIVSDADREAVVAYRAVAVDKIFLNQVQTADVIAQSEVDAVPDDACAQTHAQVGALEHAVVAEDVVFLAVCFHLAADAETVVKTCERLDRNDVFDVEVVVYQHGNLQVGGAEAHSG